MQRVLLGIPIAAHAGLGLNLAVEQLIADLLDGSGLDAGAFHADAGRCREARLELDALPRIGGVVGVGEILARHFHANLLRRHCARAQIQGVEKAEHILTEMLKC